MRKRRWALGLFGLLILLAGAFLTAMLSPPAYKFLAGSRQVNMIIEPFAGSSLTSTYFEFPRKFEEVRNQMDAELGRLGWKKDPLWDRWSDGTTMIGICLNEPDGKWVYVHTPTTWMDRIRAWIEP